MGTQSINTMLTRRISVLLVYAVIGLTLAIALEEIVPLSEVEGESDLKVAFIETSDGKLIVSSDGSIVSSDGKPSEALKGKWGQINARTTVWKENKDFCGNNMTCSEEAAQKAMVIERRDLDAGAIGICAEKNSLMTEEVNVLKAEVKAGEDKIATFMQVVKNMKESAKVKAAAKEPAKTAGKGQADQKIRTQGKGKGVRMLGDSTHGTTTVSADPDVRILAPNRKMILEAINVAGVSNATHFSTSLSRNGTEYVSIFACRRKTMQLHIELKATKIARANCDTEQMRIAQDQQLETGGGAELPSQPVS